MTFRYVKVFESLTIRGGLSSGWQNSGIGIDKVRFFGFVEAVLES